MTFKILVTSLVLFGSSAFAQSKSSDLENTQLVLRTNVVGNSIAAVTNDGQWFGIKCDRGMIESSTADLVLPNSNHDVRTQDYNKTYVRSIAVHPQSAFIPLDHQAVVEICNRPNGVYVLQIKKVDEALQAQYISGQVLEANSGRTRGF